VTKLYHGLGGRDLPVDTLLPQSSPWWRRWVGRSSDWRRESYSTRFLLANSLSATAAASSSSWRWCGVVMIRSRCLASYMSSPPRPQSSVPYPSPRISTARWWAVGFCRLILEPDRRSPHSCRVARLIWTQCRLLNIVDKFEMSKVLQSFLFVLSINKRTTKCSRQECFQKLTDIRPYQQHWTKKLKIEKRQKPI